ncbi:hypothetical protein C8R44DRAFT_903188 [Mycena epipterygia]|nr:hypothetical protein C8R44DRAFT_903188 [Mycena epipterygia]
MSEKRCLGYNGLSRLTGLYWIMMSYDPVGARVVSHRKPAYGTQGDEQPPITTIDAADFVMLKKICENFLAAAMAFFAWKIRHRTSLSSDLMLAIYTFWRHGTGASPMSSSPPSTPSRATDALLDLVQQLTPSRPPDALRHIYASTIRGPNGADGLFSGKFKRPTSKTIERMHAIWHTVPGAIANSAVLLQRFQRYYEPVWEL